MMKYSTLNFFDLYAYGLTASLFSPFGFPPLVSCYCSLHSPTLLISPCPPAYCLLPIARPSVFSPFPMLLCTCLLSVLRRYSAKIKFTFDPLRRYSAKIFFHVRGNAD